MVRHIVNLARKDAQVVLQDIYAGPGLKGVPRGSVKQLRVLSYHFAYQGMGGEQNRVGMAERRRLNLPLLRIDGWAVAPHYDIETRRLEWGTRLLDEQNEVTVNYTIRLLGRSGGARCPGVYDGRNRTFVFGSYQGGRRVVGSVGQLPPSTNPAASGLTVEPSGEPESPGCAAQAVRTRAMSTAVIRMAGIIMEVRRC